MDGKKMISIIQEVWSTDKKIGLASTLAGAGLMGASAAGRVSKEKEEEKK